MLLTEEEISEAKKGHTAIIQAHPSVYPQDIAVAKAQLKKVVEYLKGRWNGTKYEHYHIMAIPREDWEALLSEVE